MVQEFKSKTQQPPTAANTASPADDSVRRIMRSRVKTFNPFRRTHIIEWNINIAYLLGHQYIGLRGGHLVRVKNVSPFAVTANKIGPAVRHDIAVATKVSPQFDVVPDTTDTNDRATAIAGNQMVDYLQRLNDFNGQRAKIMAWYDIAGIGWRKQYWDPFYKVIGNNPEPDEEGHNEQLPVGEPIYQGEAISEHTPTNEMIYDWRQNLNRLPWAIHAKPMTLGEARVRWGDKANEIQESAFLTPDGYNEFEVQLFNEFAQFVNQTGTGKPKMDPEELSKEDRLFIAYEMWQVRDRNYPLGVYSVMAGDEDSAPIMENKPYPIQMYPHGEVPFTAYDLMSFDKAVTGSSSKISQARLLQVELNDLRTLIQENIATLGGGLWKVPRESKISITRMSDGVGLMVEYDGAYPPHREPGISISGDVFAYAAKITEDLNDIFAFPQVSQGKRPAGGPKSGIGIEILIEQGLTQHSPSILQMERKDENAMNQLLSIAFANYNKRMLSIVGKDNEWTLFEYDPQSYQNKVNVRVRAGSSLPVSKAFERQLAVTLGQGGFLGPPQSPQVRKRILQVMDIGGLDTLLKDEAKDVNFARKEFSVPILIYQQHVQQNGPLDFNALSKEQIAQIIYVPPVNMFDNHDVHIIEHQSTLVAKYYEWLETGDPGMAILANAFRDHWQLHSQILAEQQYQQAILTGQIKPPDENKPSSESAGK